MSLLDACSGLEMLVPSALRGYRSWSLEMDPSGQVQLASTGVPYVWTTGELTAGCAKVSSRTASPTLGCSCALCRAYTQRYVVAPDPRHAAPIADCTCGFYGWYRPGDIRIVPAPIRGVIEASGRVQLGTHGFRAERVRLLAISSGYVDASTQSLLARLSAAGVKVYPILDELVQAFPPEDITGLIDHSCDERCDELGRRKISMAVPPAVSAQMQRNAQATARVLEQLFQQLVNPSPSTPTTSTQQAQDPYEKALEKRRTRGTGPQHAKRWWQR